MSVEVELKLALPLRLAPRLRQLPFLWEREYKRRWFANSYLDTPDRALLRLKVAVRQRQIRTVFGKTTWLLSVKTAGETLAGLSRRQEWEFFMSPDRLDFSGVDDAPLRDRLESLADTLSPVFHVDFVRQSWDLPGSALGGAASNESLTELALDFGHIRAATGCGGRKERGGERRTQRESFCEVELELLRGGEDALAAWSGALFSGLPELSPLPVSKAARGYAMTAAMH